MNKTVAMIGVGKLGQDCAEVMSKYYDVVGYDVEPRNPSFPMKPTIEEAVKGRNLIFIAAPTPHDSMYGGETPTSHLPKKDFDYTIVTNILTEVNKYVNRHQLVVLISTVLPGTVRRQLRKCITNARFIYNPYLIAMGTVKWDMVNPEMVIIGTEHGCLNGDAEELIDFYKPMMENNPRYEVGTWDEAESIKIFYNTFISTKLALVNMIQDVAETNGNINVDVVTNALAKSTHRIMGPAYMKAGLGDAGACHPRDNIALRYLSERLNLGYDLFEMIMTAREIQSERIALKCLEYSKNVVILGKAYKPAVPYTNGSCSLLIGHYIKKYGGEVYYYDPNTGDTTLPDNVKVFLIGYWEKWVEDFEYPKDSYVIDPWRKIENDKLGHVIKIIHYGNTRHNDKFFTDRSPTPLSKDLWNELKDKDESTHLYYASRQPIGNFIDKPDEIVIAHINNEVAKGKKNIVFDNCHEAFNPFNIYNLIPELELVKIHKILDKINTDPSNIYYLTSCLNTEEFYEEFCKKLETTKKINLVPVTTFERVVQLFLRKDAEELDKEYEIKQKSKKYLCYNRLPHFHRQLLLCLLSERNLIKDSFYSFYFNKEFIPEHCKLENLREIISTPLVDAAISELDKIDKTLPLKLTLEDKSENPIGITLRDINLHRESYFSVITETYFFKSNFVKSVFFSEKTFRAIICKHPFILVSAEKSLTYLKKLGYKTFHPYINESYDQIESDEERILAIVNEIERLYNLSDEQWIELQHNLKPILEHNYQILKNKTNYCLNNDIKLK